MTFDVAAVRREFPLLARRSGDKPLHYLDSAATAQVPKAVIDAVTRHETTARANVRRGVYGLAEQATEAYENARRSVGRYLNADPMGVVFTSGGTAALNLVATAFGETLAPGDEIVISELEHHSNIVPWQMLRDRRGVVVKWFPVTDEGRLDLAPLGSLITGKCKLVSLTHASNVTGAISFVGPVVGAAHAVGAKVLLDGCQAATHGPVDVSALGADFYVTSGHKMFGPTGIGVLWGRPEVLAGLPPFLGGGEMIERVTMERATYADPPWRFEAGTPPVTQAIGLAAACEWLMSLDWTVIAIHETRLKQRLLDGLSRIDAVRIVGPTALRSRIGVVSFDVAGAHPHDICQILDRHGVAARGRSPLRPAADGSLRSRRRHPRVYRALHRFRRHQRLPRRPRRRGRDAHMSDDLYHAAIMDRARAANGDHRLANADATVTVDNPLCGDRITLDLRMDGERIAAVGYRVRGCALCQASTSVSGEVLPGATRSAVDDAEAALRGLLETGAEPAGRWAALAMFRPVGPHRSRHGCVLLAMQAVRKALVGMSG